MNSNIDTSALRLAGHSRWSRALAGICGLVLCLATAAAAQYTPPVNPAPTAPVSPTPTTPVNPGTGSISLVGMGGAAPISANGFRVTFSAPYQAGAVWMVNKQPIANGFQTSFQFQISNIGGITDPTPFGPQQGGDGFAFLIQNFSIPVVGPPAGFLGYHGLPNSLAVEFDTWMNQEPGFLDPNGNHISVHSRGTAPNSVSELASLGQATQIPFMKDGALHQVVINYTPGTLSVFMDNLTNPVLTVPNLDLSRLLALDNGTAWIGFTGATGAAWESHDIFNWQIGQAGVPVSPVTPFPVVPPPATPMPYNPTQPFTLVPSTTAPAAPAAPASPAAPAVTYP